MRTVTPREKKALKAFDYALGLLFIASAPRAPVGSLIQKLPDHVRKDLKLLKSEDLLRRRIA